VPVVPFPLSVSESLSGSLNNRLSSLCRFPSSVTKPGQSSCCLYDAHRITSNQVPVILITVSHTLQLLMGCKALLDTSSAVHFRSTPLSIPAHTRGVTFPKRSAPWLFTTAPSGGLTPPPARRCRWTIRRNRLHHLNYSMQ